MKIAKEYNRGANSLSIKFFIDVYGKRQYFLVKSILHNVPMLDESHEIKRLLRFFMLDPIIQDNGEVSIEAVVYDTFKNVADFKMKIPDEDDIKELFINLLRIFDEHTEKSLALMNDFTREQYDFGKEEVRCIMSYVICQDIGLLKKKFSDDVVKMIGEPYDPFFEAVVKSYLKAINEAEDSEAWDKAYNEFYKILK